MSGSDRFRGRPGWGRGRGSRLWRWRAGALAASGALVLTAAWPAAAQTASSDQQTQPVPQAQPGPRARPDDQRDQRAQRDQPAPRVQRIGFSLTVSHASDQPGPVDPAVEQLHESLRNDFRYRSLRVIERRQLSLAPGEIGGLDLPGGKRVRIRPLHMGPGGVLLAVDIENTLHTDLRLPDRRPVVIGVDRYDDGKLILTLEPELPPR